ncbi:MAG: LuxR family transcriptional regulator, partial [Slackia sp.]|nr:LuxR family transcriptional regulator [Slackia sp.]
MVREVLEESPAVGFRLAAFPCFSLAFFGIGLTRLWYQYNLYNLHFSADSGIATVAANLIRVGVIVVLLVIARKAELSQRARRFLVWGSMVLMTLASLCYFVELHVGTTSFESLRYVFTG